MSRVQDPSLALGLHLPPACPDLTLDVGNSTWASFLSRHGSKIMVCEKDPALKNRCHIRYMHLFSTIKYKVSISVSNALGHNTTAITFDEFTIGACGGDGGGEVHTLECEGVSEVYVSMGGCSHVQNGKTCLHKHL